MDTDMGITITQVVGLGLIFSAVTFLLGLWIGENWKRWSKPKAGIHRKLRRKAELDEHNPYYWMQDQQPDWWHKRQAD